MSLRVYNRKRKFGQTPEPKGKAHKKGAGPLQFVVQMHRASHLHFDFRLEFDGVYKSWAVPKGPSLNPQDQRLAVFVEDHPLEYGKFEGIIPSGNYGAGTVMIWDRGTYIERGSEGRKDSEKAMREGLKKGHLTFVLSGEKLKGEFALIKLKKDASDKAWLLVKKRDGHSTYKRASSSEAVSVKSGRTIDEIAAEAEAAGDVWLSKRNEKPSRVKPYLKKAAPEVKKTKATSMPRRVKPMLATLSRTSVGGSEWLYETSPEGLRALGEAEGRRAHLYSKSGLPFDKKYPEILAALQKQTQPLLLDGEIVKGKPAVYHVFDLLYGEGRDLRDLALEKRYEILQKVLIPSREIQLVKLTSKPPARGIVIAKKKSSPYHMGTSKDWLQVPVGKKAEEQAASDDGPRLTNLDKIYFPEDGLTKGDVIEYYRQMAPYILPHLKDRPESLNRHPNGIAQKGFYQKDVTGHLPRWLKTERVYSESAQKDVNYALCQDERSLLYLVNLGCIEINPWFSRVPKLDHPDYLIIDLDPDDNNPFRHVMEIALEFHQLLDELKVPNVCKTSGATGIHIGIPLGRKYDFETAREFAHDLCRIIAKRHPSTTSIERTPGRRKGKIYLDFLQNRRGQTLAAPYCLRPRDGAPVSTPLKWSELTPRLRPEHHHIGNALSRVQKFGDLWKPVLGPGIDLKKAHSLLKKKYFAD
jgi:bifunctional non-homologous end joining protein LigD